ncbi:MAG TPA: hypothetical protein VJS88_03690 [Chthoniobacterales bacterium]|nr:hypothetical protein [Chthoniobacterales bacterium]
MREREDYLPWHRDRPFPPFNSELDFGELGKGFLMATYEGPCERSVRIMITKPKPPPPRPMKRAVIVDSMLLLER